MHMHSMQRIAKSSMAPLQTFQGKEITGCNEIHAPSQINLVHFKGSKAFKFQLCICLLISLMKVCDCQVQCFDDCGLNGFTLLIANQISTCCDSGERGFMNLLPSDTGCQECADYNALQASLSITGSGISPGNNASLECLITSLSDSVVADIQWISPNGTIVQESVSTTSLIETFFPFKTVDYGDYTCVATIFSPDLPGISSTVSRTISLTPPISEQLPSVIFTSPSTPFAGDDYTLQCIVNTENVSIQWIGPNGTISSGDDITVDTLSSAGQTISTLSFSNIATFQTGRYTCDNIVEPRSRTVLVDVRLPEVQITGNDSLPVIGDPYSPECSSSIPPNLEGSITIFWISPKGVEVARDTSNGTVSISLPFSSFGSDDVGVYVCQVRVISDVLDGPVGIDTSLLVEPAPTSVSPTTIPQATDPVTTEPITTESITTEPITTELITTEPITTEFITTEPITTEGITTEPITTEPITTEPITTEGITTEPVTTDLITTIPSTTSPLTLAPSSTDLPTDPITTRTTLTDPVTTTAEPTDPVTTTLEPTDPLTTLGPTPTDFISTVPEITDRTVSGSEFPATSLLPPFPTTPTLVDECALGLDNCSKKNICTYSKNGRKWSRECRRLATCTDTTTGFICSCREGFMGDGIICRDINECLENTDDCHPDAICTNRIGSFQCHCMHSHIGDGVDCCISKHKILYSAHDVTRGHSRTKKHSKRSRSSKSQSRSQSRLSTHSELKINRIDPKCIKYVIVYLRVSRIVRTKSKCRKGRPKKTRKSRKGRPKKTRKSRKGYKKPRYINNC